MGKKKTNKKSAVPLALDISDLGPVAGDPLDFKLTNATCKNEAQRELVRMIRDHEISFITGPAGTGKSYVGLMTALKLLKDRDNPYKKIILIYPVELSQEENLGYLKGTLEDKLEPYTEVDLYTMEKIIGGPDAAGVVRRLRNSGLLEIRTAAFLRGATLDNSIVVVSEAQNFSKDTFLKILSRIGTDSKYIFNADEAQLDASSIKKGRNTGGLRYAIDVLRVLPEIGVFEFSLDDVVRNPVIGKILRLWDPGRYGGSEEEENNENNDTRNTE